MADIDKEVRAVFLRRIYAFVGNLAELRDFVEVTSKLLKKHQREGVRNSPEAYAHLLLEEHENHPERITLESDLKRAIALKFPDKFEVTEVEKAGGEKDLQIRSRPGQGLDVSAAAKEIEKTIKRHLSLRRSALISLVSACEWFAAQLLHHFLEKYPAAGGIGDKSLTYEELTQFESMDDARRWVVSSKVEDILRGSFGDWFKFFSDKLKINVDGIDEHVPYCQEACLRRNILVHNGGVVNRVYLKKLPKEIDENFVEGASVDVDEEYFENRLDRFEIVFILIALELWRKLDGVDSLRYDVATQLGYDALSQGRWDVAKAVSRYTFLQKGVVEAAELMAKVNYWQSFKWAGYLDVVRSDIEKWDVSAKGLSFQAAKDILLDKHDDAVTKLRVLVASKEVEADNLKEWPLFKGLRELGVVDELLAQAESV